MTEAFGRKVVTKKINKNVSIDIDLRTKAVRISNQLDGNNEVEIKLKTLSKIYEKVNEVLNDE
jgi:hypothetical protein